jgi:hypothetical protein
MNDEVMSTQSDSQPVPIPHIPEHEIQTTLLHRLAHLGSHLRLLHLIAREDTDALDPSI